MLRCFWLNCTCVAREIKKQLIRAGCDNYYENNSYRSTDVESRIINFRILWATQKNYNHKIIFEIFSLHISIAIDI